MCGARSFNGPRCVAAPVGRRSGGSLLRWVAAPVGRRFAGAPLRWSLVRWWRHRMGDGRREGWHGAAAHGRRHGQVPAGAPRARGTVPLLGWPTVHRAGSTTSAAGCQFACAVRAPVDQACVDGVRGGSGVPASGGPRASSRGPGFAWLRVGRGRTRAGRLRYGLARAARVDRVCASRARGRAGRRPPGMVRGPGCSGRASRTRAGADRSGWPGPGSSRPRRQRARELRNRAGRARGSSGTRAVPPTRPRRRRNASPPRTAGGGGWPNTTLAIKSARPQGWPAAYRRGGVRSRVAVPWRGRRRPSSTSRRAAGTRRAASGGARAYSVVAGRRGAGSDCSAPVAPAPGPGRRR